MRAVPMLAAVALSACAALPPETQTRADTGAVPAFVEDLAVSFGFANMLAGSCPTLTANWVELQTQAAELRVKLRARGYQQQDLELWMTELSTSEMEQRALVFLMAHNLRPADADGFCRVGEAEIARGSRIGSLLRPMP